MKNLIAALAATALLSASGACAQTPNQHGDPALRREAALSAAQARTIALHARPGAVVEWELERESGGSGLRYSFVIRARGGDFEVGVDAQSGAVLENAAEGANPD